MSTNDEIHDRLDDLFSEADFPQPEPVGDTPPPLEPETSKWELPSQDVRVEPPVEKTASSQEQKHHLGWDDYLNAIDRDDKIGFTFDQNEIAPIDGGDGKDAGLEVPLQIGDEVLGALQLELGDEWSPEDTDLLTTVAQQIAQHVENLRLLEQAEQYRTEAEQATRRLTLEGWETYLQSPDAPARGYVYDLKRVKEFDPTANVAFAGDMQYALKVREEPIGQILIDEPEKTDESTLSLVDTIAERLSTHIESLRLLDETERSRQQLDKRAAELETVAQVSTAAATILDPQSLLQSVVDLTRYSFKLYHTSVYLVNNLGNALELVAASGKIGQKMLEQGHIIGMNATKSLVAKAARSRETVIVGDISTELEFLPIDLLPDTRSEMVVPLIVADRVLGVFDFEADMIDRFTEEDALTYGTLAAQTAVALRNAQLYAEQMETVERLRELDHLKSAFLANMSHELRTPLNSILGFTQVMLEGLDGPLTDDMMTDLGLIEKNGQHLLTLINDVLDMAKIEAGRVTLSLESLDLHTLLEDVLRTTSPLARDRGDELHLVKGFEEAAVITGDAIRLRQVILNIIGNAIKFTENGTITVETEKMETKLQVRFRDNGIGIPPDKLETIFEAFSQVDTSTTRKVSGTGLGLPISRRLVELHNGKLWAESTGELGAGSVFYLELPINLTDEMVEN